MRTLVPHRTGHSRSIFDGSRSRPDNRTSPREGLKVSIDDNVLTISQAPGRPGPSFGSLCILVVVARAGAVRPPGCGIYTRRGRACAHLQWHG